MKEVGKIYECFGTFVLCTGNKQSNFWCGNIFQGVVVETDGDEEAYVGKYSETWSAEQFIETNKTIQTWDDIFKYIEDSLHEELPQRVRNFLKNTYKTPNKL